MNLFFKKSFQWLLALITMMSVSLASSAQADHPGTHFDFTQRAALSTTIDGITLTHNGNYQSLRNALQLNGGKTATVTAPKGYNITQVTLVNTSILDVTTYNYEPTLVAVKADCGTCSLAADEQTLTWTGSSDVVNFTTDKYIHNDEFNYDVPAYTYIAAFYVVLERDASVDLDHFTIATSDLRPSPDDDIVIDVANGQTFQGINYIYPKDVTIDPACAGSVYLDVNGRRTQTTLYVYDTQALFSFDNAITRTGDYAITIPAGALTATDGRTNNAITLNYSVGVSHLKYKVNLQLGAGTMPAATTISVAGNPYKHGETVNTTVALTDADVDATVEGYEATNISVNQPLVVGETTYDGSIIVSYEKLVVRVPSSEISPATGNFNIDSNSFNNICVKFPENIASSLYVTDAASIPAGLTLTGPAGSVDLRSVAGWSGSNELYVSFPMQYALGTYTLTIPEDLLSFESGNKNMALSFEWNLTAQYFQFDRYYHDTLKEFAGFTLQAPEGVTLSACNLTSIKRVDGFDEETREPSYTEVPVSVNVSGSAVTFTFAQPIVTLGYYEFVIPEGAITTTDGRVNREMNIYQSVDPTDYIDIVSVTPESYTTVDGPFTSIVLTLGSELNPARVAFGENIVINGTDVAVTATLNGTKLTLSFADDAINYDSNDNNISIPEGFISTRDGAISRSCWMWNVYVNAPKVPLQFTGIQMGWDGAVVTESGAKVEQVGVLLLRFAEAFAIADDADLSLITVTDGAGNVCEQSQGNGWQYDDTTFFLWVNPTMTEIGTYTLHVPAGFFVTESGLANAEINFDFVISDIDTFVPETSIANGATVDRLTELVLTARDGITFSHFTDYPANFFYLTGEGISGDGKIYNQVSVAEDGKTATLRLGNIKRNGEYTITIPKGYLRATADNTGNAELVIRVTVDHNVLPYDVNDDGNVDAADVTAARNYMLGYGYGMGSDDNTVLEVLDLNGDGEITIGELTKLIEVISAE